MNVLFGAIKKISWFEKIILGLTVLSVVLKYIFNVIETLDILAFGMTWAILYFPLGFYSIGKPSPKHGFIFPVVAGIIYAFGITCIITGTLHVFGYVYAVATVASFFVVISLFLLFKLLSASYPKEYVFIQYFRMGIMLLLNLIILVNFNIPYK